MRGKSGGERTAGEEQARNYGEPRTAKILATGQHYIKICNEYS